MSTAKKELIREAVEAIERAIALHIDDESPACSRLANQDPLTPKEDEDAQQLERMHEPCGPEWSAIRFSLSSSIHSLNISLSLLHGQDSPSPADRLALRKQLVDNAKAAGREAYQSALSLCDYAPKPSPQSLPDSPPLCLTESCEDCLAANLPRN
jgi:hypothetical protein